jgi:hypothetical protein
MCLNVESSFLEYKESGSIDKTLIRLKLLKPKLPPELQMSVQEWIEEINRQDRKYRYDDLLGPSTS